MIQCDSRVYLSKLFFYLLSCVAPWVCPGSYCCWFSLDIIVVQAIGLVRCLVLCFLFSALSFIKTFFIIKNIYASRNCVSKSNKRFSFIEVLSFILK